MGCVLGNEHKNVIMDAATQFSYICEILRVPTSEGAEILVYHVCHLLY